MRGRTRTLRTALEPKQPYLAAMRRHVHQLVAMGYRRLAPSHMLAEEEPAITGELVTAICEAMNEASAPAWVSHYAVRDDPPLNTSDRKGRSRFRVDMEFEGVTVRPRPRLRFEAKRLGTGHPVSGYLGDKGLGCFLSGDYPVPDGEAGMLGYVQSSDEQTWAAKLSSELGKGADSYFITENGKWRRTNVVPELKHTYDTRHAPPKLGTTLLVHHVLLRFC